MTPRERVWFAIHDLLPDGWRVGPRSWDPGRHRWDIAAISPKYHGRLNSPATITVHGEDELHVLTELALRLRELRGIERRMALEEKARAAFLHGARITTGRASAGR